MSPACVNRHLELLRAALRFARAEGFNHRDPLKGVSMLKIDNIRDRVCSEDEFARLTAAANAKLKLAITLGYNTEMRLGEIVWLTWDRVDLDARLIRLYELALERGPKSQTLSDRARDRGSIHGPAARGSARNAGEDPCEAIAADRRAHWATRLRDSSASRQPQRKPPTTIPSAGIARLAA
jgi:integrase